MKNERRGPFSCGFSAASSERTQSLNTGHEPGTDACIKPGLLDAGFRVEIEETPGIVLLMETQTKYDQHLGVKQGTTNVWSSPNRQGRFAYKKRVYATILRDQKFRLKHRAYRDWFLIYEKTRIWQQSKI